ncbi:hypothetical protein BD770DRAFT_401200 [Pilaira anomala]|nr:hypothetical protein BD770DRAFT_401200 [Pilaira anomala]
MEHIINTSPIHKHLSEKKKYVELTTTVTKTINEDWSFFYPQWRFAHFTNFRRSKINNLCIEFFKKKMGRLNRASSVQ